ncbi:MAG: YihY/virulence factor BrkB family protein [Firmicutes bacterium]|nr:YihY/virulence factor BrkB family protein [Bacillota bacterium]
MQKYKELILKTIKIYGDCKMNVYAGNATLFIITAAFPFLMLIISIVNLLPGYSPKDVTDLFSQILPDLDSLKDLVESMITNLRNQSGGLLASVAALTTLWSASAGINAIQAGLNGIDGAQSGKGILNIIKRVLFTLVLVILIPALLVFEMLGKQILGLISNTMEKIGVDFIESDLTSILNVSSIIVIVAAFVAVLFIFAYLPTNRHSLKSQIPGTIFTGVSWFVFTKLFAFFIPRFYHASSLYGSLASLFLAFLWVRIIIMILFLGGALNKALEGDRR